jgi:hypothetical protein
MQTKSSIDFIEKIEKQNPQLKKYITTNPVWITDFDHISEVVYRASRIRLGVDAGALELLAFSYFFAVKNIRCSEVMDAIASTKMGMWKKMTPEEQEPDKPIVDYRFDWSDDTNMIQYHHGVMKEKNEAVLPFLEYFDTLSAEAKKNGMKYSDLPPSMQDAIRKAAEIADAGVNGKPDEGWADMAKAKIEVIDETDRTQSFNQYSIHINTDFGLAISFSVNNYAAKNKAIHKNDPEGKNRIDTKVKDKDAYRKSLKQDFLKKRVDTDIKNLLFPDVIKYLYKNYDLHIVAPKTLFPQEQRVRLSLQKKDIPLDKLLDAVCEAFGKKEYKAKNMPYAMEWELRSSNIIVMRFPSTSYRMREWQAEQDKLKALKKK